MQNKDQQKKRILKTILTDFSRKEKAISSLDILEYVYI